MNIISKMKRSWLPFTPMEESSPMRTHYCRTYSETGANDNQFLIIINPGEHLISAPLSTLKTYALENNNREYIKLYSEFLAKWANKQSYFEGFSKTFVYEKIKEVIFKLITVNPDYITFDLTEDCSVFFQSSINGFNLYFELYFIGDTREEVEAIVNIYKNQVVVEAFGGSIDDVFNKIKSVIVVKNYYTQATESYNAISEETFTEAELQTC